MKIIIALIMSISFCFANYSIYYGELKLGIINNLDTIKDNYLKVKVTNSIARLLLGKKELIFYNDKYTEDKNNNDIKYKRDKYYIIDIIKQSVNNKLVDGTMYINDEKYIDIKKKENYTFKYISKGRVKSDGNIKVENAQLIALVDEKNHLKIIKN